MEANLLLLISEVRNLPELCQKHIKFQSVLKSCNVSINFQVREKYSQNSFKALNVYSVKSNGEVKLTIAILMTFCQSEIVDMKHNWQDQRSSDKFRDCQDRQLNKCQTNACCSTAYSLFPECFLRASSLLHTSLPLTKAFLVRSMCSYLKTQVQNPLQESGFKVPF